VISFLEWIYPKLPEIDGITWCPGWPQDFNTLPRGCFRLADDSTGVVTTEGEGSARVGIYTDTWHKTPEDREAVLKQLKTHFDSLGMSRGMTRQVEELRPDGQLAYRLTVLWSGEYDHEMGRMCRP